MILAWASLDAGLLMLCFRLFELSPRNGRILFGNMPIKGRLGKIKELGSVIEGAGDITKLCAAWEKGFNRFCVPRNAVCHMHFFGHIKGHPDRLVFGPSKALQGSPDDASLLVISQGHIEGSRDWARAVDKSISQIMQALKKALREIQEQDSPPTPR
jgi:hypothetical protein